MSCQAQILVVKSTGRPVKFTHRPHGSSMRIVPSTSAGHAHAGAATAGNAVGTAAATPTEWTPAYLQWAYDLTGLAESAGTGDTVAIVDAFDDPNALWDLAQFRYTYGIWPCATATSADDCQTQITANNVFQQYNQSGQPIDQTGDTAAAPLAESEADEPYDPNPGGWEIEESLDVDAVSSFCNHCTIDLVESDPGDCDPNLDHECAYPEFDANLQTAVETAAEALNANQISMSFSQPEDAGQAPAGLWAFPRVASVAASGDIGFLGTDRLSGSYYVSYPAALSDVTAVGGTSISPTGNLRGFGESVWNDSQGATESGCNTSQTEPTYQTAISNTECSGRAYNDVSADADPDTGLYVCDSFGETGTQPSCSWATYGGTSLATPLTAAFDAVTGVDNSSSDPGTASGSVSGTRWPAWPYSKVGLLNDVTSGSDGSCATNALLLCDAATGWDGPTGVGSLSGDVINGAPGIAASAVSYMNANDATFTGGVYPNGATTMSAWQYWPDGTDPSTSAQNTQSNTLTGSTVQAVSQSVCGTLQAGTKYDYRLVASNTYVADPVYGYYGSFTTPTTEAAPSTSTNPTIGGTAAVGQTLTAQPGTWNDQQCDSSPTYQWQAASSSTATFNNIANATSTTYVPTAADAGYDIRVAVSETNNTTSSTATVYSSWVSIPGSSMTITPTTTTQPTSGLAAMMLVDPTLKGMMKVGATTAVSPGTYTNATAITVRFYRCAHTCVLLRNTSAYRYKLQRADRGRYIKVVVTAEGAAGTAPVVSTRWRGPIRAATAGVVTIGAGAKVAAVASIRGTRQATLAHVLVVERRSRRLALSITRVGRVKTSVWAFVVRKGAVVSCTTSRVVRGHLTLTLPTLKRGESLKLVTVRA